MFKKIGHQYIAYDAAGEGGSGGAGGGAPGGEGGDTGAHPVAPWNGADGVWSIGEGDTATPWYGVIPEEGARQHVEAKGYKNPAELALANYNLTKLQRGDPTVIGVPGKDATPEQMSEFYGKLGRPDSPEGYDFKFGEGVKVDDGMLSFARSAFHEAGLTPQQAQLVADKWNEFAAKQNGDATTAMSEQNAAELKDLETRWAGDLEKNKAAGQRVVQSLGLKADLISKVENQIGSAAIVELLAAIGRKSDEGAFTAGNQGGDPDDPSQMTSQQAQTRIDALRGDADFQKKFNDAGHPGHKDAVKLMERLYSRI